MIILYGIYSFIKEYLRNEKENDKYTTKEDYLEALMKIFQNTGTLIDKKVDKQNKKKSAQEKKDDEEKLLDTLDYMKYMIEECFDSTDKVM